MRNLCFKANGWLWSTVQVHRFADSELTTGSKQHDFVRLIIK